MLNGTMEGDFHGDDKRTKDNHDNCMYLDVCLATARCSAECFSNCILFIFQQSSNTDSTSTLFFFFYIHFRDDKMEA